MCGVDFIRSLEPMNLAFLIEMSLEIVVTDRFPVRTRRLKAEENRNKSGLGGRKKDYEDHSFQNGDGTHITSIGMCKSSKSID